MWPFKRQQPADTEPSEFVSNEAIIDVVNNINEQLTKFIRWSYRNQRNASDAMQAMQESLETIVSERQELQRHLLTMQMHWTQLMISWLDDLDLLTHESQGMPSSWSQLVERWSKQILEALAANGITELAVLHRAFDPKKCEALGSAKDEVGQPYEVVKVLRRGYTQEDRVYRKAQVIVVSNDEEEIHYSGNH